MQTGGFQGVVGGDMESSCLTFVEFPFEMMKMFWNKIEVYNMWLYNIMRILNFPL